MNIPKSYFLLLLLLLLNACSSVQVSFAGSSTPDEDIVEEEKEIVGLDLDLDYPVFEIEKIDAAVTQYINHIESETAPTLFEMYKEAKSYNPEQQPYALKLRYEIMRADTNAIDFIFTQTVSTGGSHDQITIKTFRFDPQNGEEIAPLDVVDSDHTYALETLSASCKTQLMDKLLRTDQPNSDTDRITAHTLPVEDNFKHVVRSTKGIIVYFEPDTVAPTALGIQSVSIPSVP